jgi:glycosyltransferase involved in cell wall biosynthesis
MNLAILHYHLNRGGVARVIENQLRALDAVLDPREPWPVVLIHGGRREGWNESLASQLRAIRLTLEEVAAVDYDVVRPGPVSGGLLAEELTLALRRSGFGPRDTVVHVHNHALGKNVALPAAVTTLAEQGYPLLLQIHDFPEDLRKENFRRLGEGLGDGKPAAAWHGRLYPQAPHVHYAVLNGRDYGVLQSAGVDDEQLHLLPNPVPMPGHLPPREHARQRLAEQLGVEPKQRFLLYPVRCIRRKNVGEALLYSQLAEPDTVIGLTLPPLNPAEVPIYEEWKRTSDQLDLSCRFDVAVPGTLTFDESLAAADLMITTSVAEGFGMVFLETWLTGNMLVGRDLPEITGDFLRAGLRLDLLQPRLLVPVAWIGEDRLRSRLAEAYLRTLAAYGRCAPADLTQQIQAKITDDGIDFGDLDEPLQRNVLEAVAASPENRHRVLSLNPWLGNALTVARVDASERIERNRERVEAEFALEPSGRRLEELLRRVANSDCGRRTTTAPLPHSNRILDTFLELGRFRMVRS